jgi:hypothetical protein
MRHPNGARQLAAVIAVDPQPEATARDYARWFGTKAQRLPTGAWSVNGHPTCLEIWPVDALTAHYGISDRANVAQSLLRKLSPCIVSKPDMTFIKAAEIWVVNPAQRLLEFESGVFGPAMAFATLSRSMCFGQGEGLPGFKSYTDDRKEASNETECSCGNFVGCLSGHKRCGVGPWRPCEGRSLARQYKYRCP